MSLEWQEPQTPDQIMEDALNEGRKNFYCLFSGGKDSTCSTHFVATNYPDYFAGAVFAVTGIGVSETRKFVIDVCKKKKWPLHFTWPKPYETFTHFVLKFGFPGPGSHKIVMGFLKYHPWANFMHERYSENPAFISGVRKKESKIRRKVRRYSKKPIDWDGKLCFVKPFLYKNGLDIWDYLGKNHLPITPVHNWLNRSGECNCLAFNEGYYEKMMIKTYDPITWDYIQWLEALVKKKGSKKALQYPTWGSGPSTMDVEAQTFMEDYCAESCEVE